MESMPLESQDLKGGGQRRVAIYRAKDDAGEVATLPFEGERVQGSR